MRGFLLSLDGLLALSLITLTAWFFLSQGGYFPDLGSWILLANDRAIGEFDLSSLNRISGLKAANAPPISPIFVHGAAYRFPVTCQGDLVGNEMCFSQNDAMIGPHRFEAWVGS